MATAPGNLCRGSKRFRPRFLLALFSAILCTLPQGVTADTAQQRSDAVVRVVHSLLGYARWPTEPEVLRLCVDGSARYAARLSEGGTLATGRPVQARRIDLQDAGSTAGCDSVYLGAMTDARRKKISTELIGRPVLVITEEDFECEIGSMFCLHVLDGHVSFRVNLDAVARSGIHIHPGVLQLGRRRGPPS
ncbi:YfiR family protein [Cupriavidus basilensis]|uniref:YfiR family protein n=1 Tax=Cupriavidus basilensis TaxID=68895 RepID=A0ABT6AGI3_9BURK|nr:YfiR family protein [Cupriavidus basilensis]MDF3831707.1 YfiR family protein [Cupriavidus basilensis]